MSEITRLPPFPFSPHSMRTIFDQNDIEFLTDFEKQKGLKETIVTSKEIATEIEWERFGKGKNTSKIHLLTYPPRQDNVWRIYSYHVN